MWLLADMHQFPAFQPFLLEYFLGVWPNNLLFIWMGSVHINLGFTHTENITSDSGDEQGTSSSDKQAASSKRREQVRRAQRYAPRAHLSIFFTPGSDHDARIVKL